MKKTKSILIILSLIISGSLFAQHQGGGQRGGQPGPPAIPTTQQIEEMVSSMADEISLSSEQENTIYDLYTDHFKVVKQKMSSNARPKREEMEALQTDLEKKIKAELSKKQLKLYKSYLKKQQSNRPPR